MGQLDLLAAIPDLAQRLKSVETGGWRHKTNSKKTTKKSKLVVVESSSGDSSSSSDDSSDSNSTSYDLQAGHPLITLIVITHTAVAGERKQCGVWSIKEKRSLLETMFHMAPGDPKRPQQ